MGIQSTKLNVGLGTGHEESTELCQGVEAGKINIPAIHDVVGTRFWDKIIQDVHIMVALKNRVLEGTDCAYTK